MRVLLVGSGGREHALAMMLARSPLLEALIVAPGNPGTARYGRNVAVAVDDVAGLVELALGEGVDLVIPGPEAPLVAGLADACAAAGLACAGPSRAAAALEGSKAFTKSVADAAGIPTARYEHFTDADAADEFVRRRGAPIVVKADGLAAGKGVVVAESVEEALAAIDMMMRDAALGASGSEVVIEECLRGQEVSLFALCDGLDAVLVGAAQDHKRIGEGDTGPNTGGMGALCPPPHFDRAAQEAAMDVFVRPALAEMARRGTPFRGVLFVGLMLTGQGPKLIEYNVRFGDPEAQVLLPRLTSDLLAAFAAMAEGRLSEVSFSFADIASVGVVVAGRGYPGTPARGGGIDGIAQAEALDGVQVFQAATKQVGDRLVGDGGRVLTVCAQRADLRAAREAAYAALANIVWADGVFRRDIAERATKQ